MQITKIVGREILDSRGMWTIEVTVFAGTYVGIASVPCGKSVGTGEAFVLRDTNGHMKHALQKIILLDKHLRGYSIFDQKIVDSAMIALDGTEDKHRFGENTLLAVSLAVARCAASVSRKELFQYLKRGSELPVPFANVINGGLHAGNGLKVQEFHIVPYKARSFTQAVCYVQDIYEELGIYLKKKYGAAATLVGDEGGYAPCLKKTTDVLDILVKVLDSLHLSHHVGLALDVAANSFYQKGVYHFEKKMTSSQLSQYYYSLIDQYSLLSLEDPFAETDYAAWKSFSPRKVQVIGDDLLVTHLEKVQHAYRERWCSAVLVKPNQVGTLTETFDVMQFARKHSFGCMVSHRSGETNDTFIADLSVGCGQIKLGPPCRGERVAKYNRLLEIQSFLGKRATYAKVLR